MVRYILHILIALGGLLLQATLFSTLSHDLLKPDLAFLVVVHLGLQRPMGEATPAVVVIGYLADRFSALPDGTFMLVYLCAFYLAAAGSKVFYFRGTGFPAVMVGLLSVAYVLALDGMVRYGHPKDMAHAPSHGMGFMLLFALANVLFALPLYRLNRAVDGDHDLHTTRRATLT